jgi:hypothetical protein
MMRWGKLVLCLGLAGLVVGSARVASAELITKGRGKKKRLVASQFGPRWQSSYQLFSVRCTKCHAMARPVNALVSGITPVTGSSFERHQIQRYVVKMMRKPKSGVNREDAKKILKFLWYARSLAKQ